jgi:hypothetical protein
VTNDCQSLGPEAARRAERAMYDLVEGCTSIPGAVTQFQATLEPGGRIEITPGRGQPEVIPVCVLKHALVHEVPLRRPCGLRVRLEQSTVAISSDAGNAR